MAAAAARQPDDEQRFAACWRDGLEYYLGSAEQDGRLNALGAGMVTSTAVSRLRAGVSMSRFRESNPELASTPLAPPIFITGGWRTGTTFLFRLLATDPRLILLDEPFAGVDPIAVLDIQKIIGFLRARGIGVLITDHNVRETLGICDRAYIISEGRVLASGKPSEIIENEQVRRVYLGEHFRL